MQGVANAAVTAFRGRLRPHHQPRLPNPSSRYAAGHGDRGLGCRRRRPRDAGGWWVSWGCFFWFGFGSCGGFSACFGCFGAVFGWCDCLWCGGWCGGCFVGGGVSGCGGPGAAGGGSSTSSTEKYPTTSKFMSCWTTHPPTKPPPYSAGSSATPASCSISHQPTRRG